MRRVAYWSATAVVVGELGLGGVWDVLRIPYVRGLVGHLGYPMYFLTILGVWKLAGAVVLALPRLVLAKEWAYAGAFFTYTGAVASHLTVGDGPGEWALPLLIGGLTVASWALRPADRRVPTHALQRGSRPRYRSRVAAASAPGSAGSAGA
jgi:DoxX-like family